MISKALFKNTIKELLRTRQAIFIGILSIAIVITIVSVFKSVDSVFGMYSFIIFVMAMLFTVGIIDSDISDGKIQTVLVKPVSHMQFFLSKVLAVILLGSIIIVTMVLSSLIIISVQTSIDIDIKIWFLLPISGIISITMWALISSTFSTFVKGYSNITAIILFSILFGALTIIPNETLQKVIKFTGDYILPNPDACIDLLKESKAFLSSKLFHSLFYIVLLSIIGPLILSRRELGKK